MRSSRSISCAGQLLPLWSERADSAKLSNHGTVKIRYWTLAGHGSIRVNDAPYRVLGGIGDRLLKGSPVVGRPRREAGNRYRKAIVSESRTSYGRECSYHAYSLAHVVFVLLSRARSREVN